MEDTIDVEPIRTGGIATGIVLLAILIAGSASLVRAAEPAQDKLTADYLSGTWCSVYGGQEVTQWEFEPNGDHRIGFPSGSRMAMRAEVHPLDSFHDRYETLIERDTDTFTTRHKHGRDNVFTRGACEN